MALPRATVTVRTPEDFNVLPNERKHDVVCALINALGLPKDAREEDYLPIEFRPPGSDWAKIYRDRNGNLTCCWRDAH